VAFPLLIMLWLCTGIARKRDVRIAPDSFDA
jgi:hypothetical protein